MHCSKKAVQLTVTTYQFETFQEGDARREYKRKTTKREDRYIECILKQNYDVPLKDITNLMQPNISPMTLHRRRSEVRLNSYVIAVKPGVKPENVDAQLK